MHRIPALDERRHHRLTGDERALRDPPTKFGDKDGSEPAPVRTRHREIVERLDLHALAKGKIQREPRPKESDVRVLGTKAEARSKTAHHEPAIGERRERLVLRDSFEMEQVGHSHRSRARWGGPGAERSQARRVRARRTPIKRPPRGESCGEGDEHKTKVGDGL